MSVDLVSLVRAIIRDELLAYRTASLGIVTGQHPHAAAPDLHLGEVDVTLRDDGLELARVPVVTPRIGTACLPEEGELVVVQFLDGDINRPLVHGRLHSDKHPPPPAAAREWVHVSPHKREPGTRRVHLAFPNGDEITLDDTELAIELGGTRVVLGHDGDVEIEAAGAVRVTGATGAEIESGASLSLKATGALSLEAASIDITAQQGASINGGAQLSVKGALVDIVGQSSFSPG